MHSFFVNLTPCSGWISANSFYSENNPSLLWKLHEKFKINELGIENLQIEALLGFISVTNTNPRKTGK